MPVNTNWGPGRVNTNWGPGPKNTKWGPGPVNKNLGPGPVNANWGPELVNTNWVPGPVNTNWGPGPGAKQRTGGREIQIPQKEREFFMKKSKMDSQVYYNEMENGYLFRQM